jgi:hypothetical protein
MVRRIWRFDKWCHSEIRYDGSECVCEKTGFAIQAVLTYFFAGTAGKEWNPVHVP